MSTSCAEKPPKSLDRNDFAGLQQNIRDHSDVDGLATLAAATIASVKAAFGVHGKGFERVLVCGGGRKNDHLMAGLRAALSQTVEDIDDAGFDGDMLEAQAFAYLALRVERGLSLSAPGTTGVAKALSGGRMSLPG